jgi:hypothetical protein
MIECTMLSDRMVEVLHHGKPWTELEAAHLAACPDCSAEWEAVSRTASLGRELPPLDSAVITARIKQRLAAGNGHETEVLVFRRHPVTRWALGLAAAAALTFAVVRGRHRDPRLVPTGGPTSVAAAAAPLLTELDELSAPELEVVLKDWQTDEAGVTGNGLGDLTSDELERLLRSWEG